MTTRQPSAGFTHLGFLIIGQKKPGLLENPTVAGAGPGPDAMPWRVVPQHVGGWGADEAALNGRGENITVGRDDVIQSDQSQEVRDDFPQLHVVEVPLLHALLCHTVCRVSQQVWFC